MAESHRSRLRAAVAFAEPHAGAAESGVCYDAGAMGPPFSLDAQGRRMAHVPRPGGELRQLLRARAGGDPGPAGGRSGRGRAGAGGGYVTPDESKT